MERWVEVQRCNVNFEINREKNGEKSGVPFYRQGAPGTASVEKVRSRR